MDDLEALKKQTLASSAPKEDDGVPEIVEYNQDDIRSWKQEEDAKKPPEISYTMVHDIPILEPLEHKNLYDDSKIKPRGDIRKFEDGQAEVDTELSKLHDQIKEMDSGEEYWKILHERGFALSRIGQYEEAIKYYDKALDIVPHNEEILSNKGVTLFTLGRLDEAKVCFSTAIKATPTYEKAWNNLGVVMRSEGKLKEALRCYNMSIKANPMYKNAWYNKGFILEDMGRLEEAIRYYNKALEISPNYAEAVYSREECLKKLAQRRLKEKQKMELAYKKEILQMDQKIRREMGDMARLRTDGGELEEEPETVRPVRRPRIKRGA
jgi:tetratricopeptide (TPR) repeat protein